jgi:preprotein translocase subunit SecB
VIFPYASAALSDLVSKGGFQQLLLAPVNFAVLYKKQMESAKVAAED